MSGVRKQRSGLFSSLTGGAITLRPDSFEHEGKDYRYEDVCHLGRYARQTSLNFLPLGDYVRIRIWVDGSPKPITLENAFGLVGTTGRLEDTYRQLVERTYQVRLRRYLLQVERQGYFEYDEAKFLVNGEAVADRNHVNVRSSSISSTPFRITFTEGQGANERGLSVSTEVDGDVFYGLLKALYGRYVA